ncbi:MAG: LL-diaminopimelate aminotransferase [Cyanobacteria bacterium P01_F01_bin.42]
MQLSNRLDPLPHNVFAAMDEAKAKARQAGRDLIDLSLGSSDLPVSAPILERIAHALKDSSTHGYLLFQETLSFRQAAANWYEQRFGLAVDPVTEVLPLIGSQEGTAHLPLAILNPKDYALLLDPGYPSHAGGVLLANGQVHTMPLTAANQYLPDFGKIPHPVMARARMMVLSYPHNPTAAVASLEFFQEAVAFCQAHDMVLVHDFPYVDFVFSGQTPPSVLQADRDRRCSIEFFTLSKSHNMGGFRVGYAIGNQELIQALRRIKAIVDFNQYRGILNASSYALEHGANAVQDTVNIFRERQNFVHHALDQIGWSLEKSPATMYTWAPLPSPWHNQSLQFSRELVAQTGVALSPGSGFGNGGEGYVRLALVHDQPILQTAVDRIGTFLHT